MTSQDQKISWKRVELKVKNFIKTAETDTERLKQFKKNLLKYENDGNRSAVRQELSRAQQTIKQLQTNLESIKRLRGEITKEDREKFDNKMADTEDWLRKEIDAFSDLDSDFIEYMGEEFHELLKAGVHVPDEELHFGNQMNAEISVEQSQLMADLEVTQDQLQRVEQLAEDVRDVKNIMTSLSTMVHEQGEVINSIEDNIESTHENVLGGGMNLNKAVVAKTAGYTTAGAAIGALIGGPVGLLAGAKIGALAAGAGMAVGAVAGRKVKNMKRDANEVELQNLQAAADMADTKTLRRESIKSEDCNHQM